MVDVSVNKKCVFPGDTLKSNIAVIDKRVYKRHGWNVRSRRVGIVCAKMT